MKFLKIETAKNGYIVHEDNPADGGIYVRTTWAPHVFESFAALTKWLRKNLDDPNKPVTPPKPKA